MNKNQREIVHDIRNALGGIRGFASLLEKDLGDKPESKRMAGIIVGGLDKLEGLINDLASKRESEDGN